MTAPLAKRCVIFVLATACSSAAPRASAPQVRVAATEVRAPVPVIAPAPPAAPDPAATEASPPLDDDDESVEAPQAAAPPPAAAEQFPFNAPLPSEMPIAKTPAMRYAKLSPAQCRAELKKRKLGVVPARGPSSGIATPVRVSAPLHGVRFQAPAAKSVYGELDCRLVLVLDDLGEVLSKNGVVAMRLDNVYRPRAHLPGKKKKKSQHAFGLAADVTAFTLADGRTLSVERDWHGALGAPACGPDARVDEPNAEAILLRNIACEVWRAGLFHHLLTPNFNAAHATHFHMDIARDGWAIIVR